ncbi:hypothetical protein QVD17_32925 [Tagetes erecta]|uniref:Ribosomal protein L34Ae n=1 Tax=Tagetes erecta TaxID=13708 RepID=A0AAD8NKB9_TARER|nr:hypothetical protein QVD17_32925 [Tagetes erecta]
MRLPMVDCRSLIEFCRAFEQHKNNNMTSSTNQSRINNNNNKKWNNNSNSVNPLSHPFCDRSPFAALDILILILVVCALGFLIIPYVNILYREFLQILPLLLDVVRELISDAPIAYLIGAVAAFSGVIATIAAWEILEIKSRKCGKPNCKGLRKAVEFDIQLEPEECVKYLSTGLTVDNDVKPLELGQDHKELEAELKKMAPVNGRTVLIFRAPCGCPAGRLEVWGSKRIRRIKK